MQSERIDHEKVSETKFSQILLEPIGQFKCPNCGRVHAGFDEADVISLVNAVNIQNKQKPNDAYLLSVDDYRRCFECGTLSSLFSKADPGDVPFLSTLQAVIAPETVCSQEQPTFIEGDGTFEIPLYVSYARHRRPGVDQAVDRRDESQQEILLPPRLKDE